MIQLCDRVEVARSQGRGYRHSLKRQLQPSAGARLPGGSGPHTTSTLGQQATKLGGRQALWDPTAL